MTIAEEVERAARIVARERARKYRAANKDAVAERQRKYYAANKDKWRTTYAENRKRKRTRS